MKTFTMLSTSGILGYGYPEESLRIGMAREPQVIGCDGGSTDPGPLLPRRRQALRLAARDEARPAADAAGGDPPQDPAGDRHLRRRRRRAASADCVAQMVREIAREDGLHFNMALIHAEQDKALMARRVAEGRTRPLGRMAPLDAATIDRATRIVGMMRAGALSCGRSTRARRWCWPGAAATRRPGPPLRDARAAAAGPGLVRRQDAGMRRRAGAARRGRTACL